MNHAGEHENGHEVHNIFFLLTATGDRQDSTYMYHVSHDIVDHVITKTYRVYSGAKASI